MFVLTVDGMDREPTVRRWLLLGGDSSAISYEFSLEVEASDDFVALRVVAHIFIFPPVNHSKTVQAGYNVHFSAAARFGHQ